VYTYLLYPGILHILVALGLTKPVKTELIEPTVTILISAYNEASEIGETIENKLALDYPEDRCDLIVVSDASTDDTDEIVGSYAQSHPDRVRFIRQEPGQGKTAALNLALPHARGEILVVADANSLYEPQALRYLVSNFGDESVGYVTGKMTYTNPDGSITGDGCTTYMRYENLLRNWETQLGSIVGVDGGIDAVRRSLYKPMRADQLPDFVLPLRVVEQGYRVVYEPRAVLREPALGSSQAEYSMRVRVTLRALWALYDLRQLFNPLGYPLFSWQLFSHKLLRYGAFLPQLLLLVTNALLISQGTVYQLLFAGQIVFYALAAFGFVVHDRAISLPFVTAPYYLTLLNFACGHAFFRFFRGKKQERWVRRTG
jgi:cellulose synthase/poly-beta-1,6-N-acetylglucosamine synthase-like glycosyltransferase